MKRFNLIKRLLSYSHEKQSPQRFARYAVMLIMLLTLGVGQVWAASSTTLYYAIPEATLNTELSGHSDYKVYARVNYKGSGDEWASIEMSNTGETYNGDLLFTCTFTDRYSGLGALYFKIGVPESDSGTFSDKIWGNYEWKPFEDTKYNNTIQVHGNLGLSNKKAYAIDKTVYFYNALNWSNIYLYTFSSECDGGCPGSEDRVSYTGDDKWYQITIYAGAASFILHNNSGTQTNDLSTSDYEDGKSYIITTGVDKLPEKTYTVSFNMHSHGDDIDDQTIFYGGVAEQPSAPSATGYTFGGWYANDSYSGSTYDFSTPITADLELHAKWTAKTTTVTLNVNGATSGSNQTITATYGAAMPNADNSSNAINKPSKTGYTFGGYYDTSASSGGTQYYTNANPPVSARTWNKEDVTSTLWARWTADTYTADNNLNKNNSDVAGSSNGKYTATYDATTIAINTAPARKGYRVEGYYQEAGCTHKIADASGNLQPNTDYTDADGKWDVTSNQTLYVNWTPNWYLYGEGAEFGSWTTDWSEGGMTYSAENTVSKTLILTAGTTYNFKIWKHGGATAWSNATSIKNITASTGPHRLYSNDPNNMNFTTSAGGEYVFTLNISDESQPHLTLTYPSGTTYTVTYGQADFYDDSATPSDKTGAAGNTVTAVDNYGKTVGSGKKILSGGNVTLTATPTTGYSFVGWYTNDDCTTGEVTTNPLTINSVSGNVEYYAKFKEKICTVRITASNYTLGDITVDGDTFDWGYTKTVGKTTKHNLVATPKEGYYFAGWVLSDGADFELQNDTGDEDNEVTLAGRGSVDGSTATLTASFMPLDKIYFRNYNEGTGYNLWGESSTNLYVYFYAYWDDGGKGAGANAKPYAQMQPIEPSSHIYWAYVPHSVTKSAASDKSHVAFADYDFSGYDNFDGYHGVYRTDYNRITNMFVPNRTGTGSYNNTFYNNTGYWMQYNPQKGVGAGYYMQRWNTSDPDYIQVAEMKPTYSGSTTLHFTLTIDDVSESNNKYMIISAGGLKYWPKEGGAAVTVTSSKCTNLDLHEDNGAHPCFVITPTVKGDYYFTVDQSSDVMKISVEYPESAVAGDYRLENAYNDGSAKTTHSNIIKATSAGSSNTVSMYLCGEGSGTLKLQKCTGISEGEPTWDAGNTTNLTSVLSTVGANKGVYYFDISIADDAVTSVPTPVKYGGDYYVHVNASTRNHLDEGEPKWSSSIGNKFTHFTKNSSFKDSYDYYWVDWFLGNSEGGGAQSVVATIGNDYNDDLAGKTPAGSTTTDGANVRYAYDSETNTFTRTMISGGGSDIKISAASSGQVTIKNKSTGDYEDATTPRSAQDIDNWMYAFIAKVMPNSEADITSTYNGDDLLLADDKKLIGGAGEDPYDVELIYDFKTNRIIGAWVPSGTISTAFDLQSNMMVIREEDDTPTIINLTGEGALNNVTQIYTVMEFGKYTWNDDRRTIVSGGGMYTDAYYWISLPYDCKVSDIFGIEGYGDYWTIQTYMGDLRAKSGWWAEIDNWWYNLDPEDEMKTGVGYVLRMTNLGYGPFAHEGVSTARLYFPSSNTANLKVEQLSAPTTELDTLICHVWRKWKNDPKGKDGEGNPTFDRRAIDSNWRILGSPSFNSTSISGKPDFLEPDDPETEEDDVDYSDSLAIRYLYTWEVESNQPRYTVTSTDGFEFKGTHAYLAQYAGTISWAAYDAGNPLVGIKAPKRERANSLDRDFRLVLNQNGKQADVAYVSLMEERATADYDLNLDLSKMMNSKQANIYTFSGLYQMAANCLPISDSMTVVPVGVKLAQDGDYTFAMPEGTEGVGVVLVDNIAGTRTNLGLTDYTVNLTAGTYDGHFSLEISPIAQTPTDVEQTSSDSKDSVRKVMVDGILYIVKDGKVFDARGNRVQ